MRLKPLDCFTTLQVAAEHAFGGLDRLLKETTWRFRRAANVAQRIRGEFLVRKNVKHIEDACGGSSPHPQTTPPSNLRVLRDHLYFPEARHVEVKARIITMTFAVNSSCWTKRMLQQLQKSMKQVTQKSCFFAIWS